MTTTTAMASNRTDYAELNRRVQAAGLLRPRPGYYLAKVSATVGLSALGWLAFVHLRSSWWQMATAAFLAFASAQLAFLGHDIGHRQVFRRRRRSEVAGLLIGNLGVGMSVGWWTGKHTRHHANPNHQDEDPDVGAGALVWTPDQARARRGSAGRWLARHQAFLFFPMLLLEGLNLHYASAKAIAIGPMRHRRAEAALLIAHAIGYFGLVFGTLAPVPAVAFIAVHQGLFGLYLGCSFAPNHKGMPLLTAEQQLDFVRKQVLTSRNVRGGRVVDFFLGGLNYQIEHHLFPSMPRPHLRRARPIVRHFCAQRAVAYHETGLIESYAVALRHLHRVGRCVG
jgi:fatty acid desaturase